MEFVGRVRWGNVARVAAGLAVLGVVVAWPRLAPPPPALPSDAPQPLVDGGAPSRSTSEPSGRSQRESGEQPRRGAKPRRREPGAAGGERGRREPGGRGSRRPERRKPMAHRRHRSKARGDSSPRATPPSTAPRTAAPPSYVPAARSRSAAGSEFSFER